MIDIDDLFVGAAHAQDHAPEATESFVEKFEHAEAHEEPIELILLVAFLLLLAIIVWKARGAIIGVVDGRIERIRRDLAEAQRLREEAQAALAGYQQRQREATGEAEAILARARAEAQRLREQAVLDVEAAMKRREAMALERIAQAEAQALVEVRAAAADVAVEATRRLLQEQFSEDPEKAQALVDAAIQDLPAKLH